MYSMELKKISKADKTNPNNVRLFVELGMDSKESSPFSRLSSDDEVLIIPKRKASLEFIDKNLLGKYISYLRLEEKTQFCMFFEGIVQKNNKKYWGGDEPDDCKFVIVDYSENEEGEIADTFDHLEDVFDLKVIESKQKRFTKTECLNKRCRKSFSESFKYCPYCGHKKIVLKKGE